MTKWKCSGCNETKELFMTETKLSLCADCIKCIMEDESLRDDIYGKM